MLKQGMSNPTQVNIVHTYGTARLQTVHKETNSRFHKLLKEFEKLSGVPILLNTSFNVMGEPIVESPIDTIRCFFSTGIDYLVLENYVLRKKMEDFCDDGSI
jgi:carbamoyltransferase